MTKTTMNRIRFFGSIALIAFAASWLAHRKG